MSLLCVSLIALSAMCYQFYRFEQSRPAMIETDFSNASQLITNDIDAWVDKNIRVSSLLTHMDAFKKMDVVQQVSALKAAQETLEWMSIIFVIDTFGDAVARSDGKPLQNYSDRDYVKQVLAGQDFGQQVFIGKSKPVPLLCFALPIKETLLMGMVTQCSVLDDISRIVGTHNFGQTSQAFIVDEQKRLIAHSDLDNFAPKLQNFSDHPALQTTVSTSHQNNHTKLSFVPIDGKQHIVFVARVGLNWTLVIQQEYTEVYVDYLQIHYVMLLLIGATLMLVVLLGWLLSKNIIRPLSEMAEIADTYSKGRFHDTISYIEREDEMGELAHAINRMSISLRLALKRLTSTDKKSTDTH